MSNLFEIVKSEIPFENWVESQDIKLEKVGDEIRVFPLSEHAIAHIGANQFLSFTPTITVANPWTGMRYQHTKEEMINPVDSYPFDPDVSHQVAEHFPDAEGWDWVVAYSQFVTPQDMGSILLGS